MSKDKFEQISALMDGEIDDDSSRIINSIQNDEDARHAWSRYHLIRDSIQGQLSETIDANIAAKVSDIIADEPTVLAPKPISHSSYIKPVAGFAIAASVTVAVLLGVQSFQQPTVDSIDSPVATNQPINNDLVQTVTLTDDNQQQFLAPDLAEGQNSTTNPRLNRYLMNYNELRVNSAVQGMPPYVRMIGYESDK